MEILVELIILQWKLHKQTLFLSICHPYQQSPEDFPPEIPWASSGLWFVSLETISRFLSLLHTDARCWNPIAAVAEAGHPKKMVTSSSTYHCHSTVLDRSINVKGFAWPLNWCNSALKLHHTTVTCKSLDTNKGEKKSPYPCSPNSWNLYVLTI